MSILSEMLITTDNQKAVIRVMPVIMANFVYNLVDDKIT